MQCFESSCLCEYLRQLNFSSHTKDKKMGGYLHIQWVKRMATRANRNSNRIIKTLLPTFRRRRIHTLIELEINLTQIIQLRYVPPLHFCPNPTLKNAI